MSARDLIKSEVSTSNVDTPPKIRRQRSLISKLLSPLTPSSRRLSHRRTSSSSLRYFGDENEEESKADLMSDEASSAPDSVSSMLAAAQAGDVKELERMLDEGGDVNARGSDGRNCLIWAARNGHINVVQLFLERGSDPNLPSKKGRTALMWAVWNCREEMCELLISHGSDVNAQDAKGISPLAWAVEKDSVSMIKLLLSHGADLNNLNSVGTTVLMAACGGHVKSALLLIASGAKTGIEDPDGRTALHHALAHIVQLQAEKEEVAPPVSESVAEINVQKGLLAAQWTQLASEGEKLEKESETLAQERARLQALRAVLLKVAASGEVLDPEEMEKLIGAAENEASTIITPEAPVNVEFELILATAAVAKRKIECDALRQSLVEEQLQSKELQDRVACLEGQLTQFESLQREAKKLQDQVKAFEEAEEASRPPCPIVSFEKLSNACDGFATSLGSGSYGEVFVGHMMFDGSTELRPVAVKKFIAPTQQEADELAREVGMLGHLKHKNLVPVLAACLEPLALVYPLMQKGSLGKHLADESLRSDLPAAFRISILRDVAAGLKYLHSKDIIHRDLKPQNVLLNNVYSALISDFDVARCLDATTTKNFTGVAGTFLYIDPVYAREGELTKPSDMYSYGVVGMQVLAGSSTPVGLEKSFRTSVAQSDLTPCLDQLVDWPSLRDPSMMLIPMINFVLQCCSMTQAKRPTAHEADTEFGRWSDDLLSSRTASAAVSAANSPIKI